MAERDIWDRYGREIRSRRKIIWLVLGLAYLIGMFHRVSPAVIVDRLFVQFNIEAAAVVGSMAAVYFYVYFLMQVPAGILADLFGARRVAAWGMAAAALGAAWFGAAGSVGGLFAGRFLVGLGVSVIFVSLMRAFSTWFQPYEYGTVMGLTISIGNLGAILASAPLAALVDSLGWRASFFLVGVASLLVAALTWVFVRDHPGEVFHGEPGILGAFRKPEPWGAVRGAMAAILKDRHLWIALTGSCCIYGPFMALVGVWGVPYIMQVYGFSRTGAASVVGLASLGVVVGGFAIGLISDRARSRKKPYIAFAFCNVLVWAALTWWNHGVPPVQGLVVLCFLLGCFGNTGLLSPIMVKEYNPPQFAGLASGIGNIGGFAGSAFMQPFFGYLLDLRWGGSAVEGVKLYSPDAYQLAFTACFISACVALAATTMLRESLTKH